MANLMQRYAVLQSGARMHYAVPALLARAGCLNAFYTDIHANHTAFNLLKIVPHKWQPKPLRRLLGRTLPPELHRYMVRDQPFASITWARNNCDDLVFTKAYLDRFGGATALYTNYINNDLDVVKKAKDLGLHIVHEMIISPDVGSILLAERNRYPGIELISETEDDVSKGNALDREKWQLSDQILVPSTYCFNTSIALSCDQQKIKLVPYGIPDHWFNLVPEPQRGRLLFVGQVGLRKGCHVLAEACRILTSRGINFECRIVGPALVDISNPLFQGPHYLGQVPRSQVAEEFRRADIFILPTLAEGMALVHLEALACGVPVITTPNCGSVVRDGLEGFIIPIRDSISLADCIQKVLTNRELRNQLSSGARQRAAEYTWKCYADRLLSALGLT